jgi:hypothetical protein
MTIRNPIGLLCLLTLGATAPSIHAQNSPEILGFENLAGWTSTSGTKTLSTERTQGAYALKVGGFWYTELLSAKVSVSQGVSGELGLDLWLPSSTTWGNLTLVATAPSVSLWEQSLGQLDVQPLRKGAWNTLRFPVSATVQNALRSNPQDLTFKLRMNLPWSDAGYLVDNLRWIGGNPATSKIEIRTPLADDFVYATVGNIRRRIGFWGQPDSFANWRDVSHWFHEGNNSVLITASNREGGQNARVELRVDGGTPMVVDCISSTCLSNGETGPFLSSTIVVPNLRRPPARTVRFTSAEPGKIYIEDQYTGLTTPATLLLPQGSYRVGLGVSQDLAPNYTGKFYEKRLELSDRDLEFDVQAGLSPMPAQHRTRIAILPVARARFQDGTRDAILTQETVSRFAQQMDNTRRQFFVPFSYGLADLDVTVLPMETETVLNPANPSTLWTEIWPYMDNGKFASLFRDYNFVVVLHPTMDQYGIQIPGTGGSAGSLNQLISFPAAWSLSRGPNDPIGGLLHEMLHQFETGSEVWHKQTFGIQGLHGAEEHGYPMYSTGDDLSPAQEWIWWQRTFMRGQVGEDMSMQNLPNPTSPTLTAPWFVGTFSSIRWGLRTPYPY